MNATRKQEFIIVQSFSEGEPLTLSKFTNKEGAFWTKGFYGAKGFTLAGAKRMATRVINRHGLRRSMLPGFHGVTFMKIGSPRFDELFKSA